MQPTDIESTIVNWISWYRRDINNEGINLIIRQTSQAKVNTFKTAPRARPSLEAVITQKTEQLKSCEVYPEREILYSELEASKMILALTQ